MTALALPTAPSPRPTHWSADPDEWWWQIDAATLAAHLPPREAAIVLRDGLPYVIRGGGPLRFRWEARGRSIRGHGQAHVRLCLTRQQDRSPRVSLWTCVFATQCCAPASITDGSTRGQMAGDERTPLSRIRERELSGPEAEAVVRRALREHGGMTRIADLATGASA